MGRTEISAGVCNLRGARGVTKLRAPLTIDNALTRIAALIGWPAMADVAQVKERTVRNWSDPDTPERCPIEAGLALDLAFQASGGEGAPIYETYGLLLEAARADRFTTAAQLANRTVKVIKEGAEAHIALVTASQPGATDADRRAAVREVEEAVAELTRTLPLLTEGAGPCGASGEGISPGGES